MSREKETGYIMESKEKKTFKVTVTSTLFEYYFVEANNEEEAKQKYSNGLDLEPYKTDTQYDCIDAEVEE